MISNTSSNNNNNYQGSALQSKRISNSNHYSNINQNPDYTWHGVLQFLYIQSQNQSHQQNLHFLEKKQLNQKIKEYQGRVIALQGINCDLLERNKMLQHCLRKMRQQSGNTKRKQPNSKQNQNNGQIINKDINSNKIKIPQRRPKPNKTQISKILSSLGINDFLNDIEQEIKRQELQLESQKKQRQQSNLDRQQNKNVGKITSPPDLLSLIKKQKDKEKQKEKEKSQPMKNNFINNNNNHQQGLFLNNQKSSLNNNQSQIKYQESPYTLLGHQDGIRDLCFLHKSDHLVSVSQDCTMKVWDLSILSNTDNINRQYQQDKSKNKNSNKSPQKQIKCVSTVRQHSGPIFSVIQIDSMQSSKNLVLTGGMQGLVRVWDLSSISNNINNQQSSNLNPNNRNKKDQNNINIPLVASWCNFSQQQKLQPVWQLLYNPMSYSVYTTSSQPAIKSYSLKGILKGQFSNQKYKNKKYQEIDNYQCSYFLSSKNQQQSGGKLKQMKSNQNNSSPHNRDTYQNFNQNQDIPTAITLHDGKLIAGYVHSHSLVTFDIETQKVISQIKFPIAMEGGLQYENSHQQQQQNYQFAQFSQISTNKLISHPRFILGAYQDNKIRIFDLNQSGNSNGSKGSIIFEFKAHDQSVMGISLTTNKYNFFSCGHDGYVKLWDIRKLLSNIGSSSTSPNNNTNSIPINSFKSHQLKYDQAIHAIQSHKSKNISGSAGADSKIKLYIGKDII